MQEGLLREFARKGDAFHDVVMMALLRKVAAAVTIAGVALIGILYLALPETEVRLSGSPGGWQRGTSTFFIRLCRVKPI